MLNCSILKRFCFVTVQLAIVASFIPLAYAQNSTHSPYSRYAIGELQYNGFSQNLGKGGIAYGVNTYNTINFLNPASYYNDTITTFELGVNSKTSLFQSTIDTSLVNRSYLSYIAFGFPIISKKWGMSLGLLPYSSIGYKLTYETLAPNGDSLTYQYDGSGGMNMFYWGNGIQLHKNFSVGFNVAYLFGEMTNSSAALFTSGDNNLSTIADKTINVSDVLLQGGFQFKVPFKSNYTFVLGGTYSNTTNVHAIKDIVTTRFVSESGSIVDTIIQDSSASGNFTIPQKVGIGFTFSKNKNWLFGADVSWQQWSAFTSPFDQFDTLLNSLHFALGAEFFPNKERTYTNKVGEYFSKVNYRAGLSYGNTFIQLNGHTMNQYSVSLGAGFPLKTYRKVNPLINVGIELGYLSSKDPSSVNEMYAKACIGFSLLDKWFDQRKYD